LSKKNRIRNRNWVVNVGECMCVSKDVENQRRNEGMKT